MSSLNIENLPEGWAYARIDKVCDVNPRLNKSEIHDDLLVSFVPMPAVGAGDGTIDVSQERPASEVKKGFTSFKRGDVLFGKITPCMENGKMAVVPKVANGYGFGSTEFHVLRPKDGVDARYVYYFVSSQNFRGVAERYMTGAVGQKRVSSTYLKEQSIPLAPSEQQKRIVAEIEKQLSRLDEAVANLKRVKANLKRYKAAVLKAAVEGKLVPISESWVERPLAQFCQVISGFAFKSSDFSETGVHVVKIANVSYGEFVWKNQGFLPAWFLKEYPGFVVRPGDILLALTRPITNGLVKACRYPKGSPDALLNQRVALLRPNSQLLDDFLLVYLQSEHFKRQLIDSLSETLQPNLSPIDLKKIPTLIPDLAAQKKIVTEVERRISIVAGAEAQVNANLRRADRLRQSILKQAFSGQLVSQEPNDEPASVLLEQIRQQAVPAKAAKEKPAPRRIKKTSPKPIPNPDKPAYASLDSILDAILRLMLPGKEYSRAEIADVLGLSSSLWNAAIQELKRRGKVRQMGERSGARYLLIR